MVQITKEHDKELNQKILRVRGDENYAKETKVSIEDADVYQYLAHNFNMKINVTLQRGMGASNLAIIDNGIAVGVAEWGASDTTKEVIIQGLTYDVVHNIQVRWLGNRSCLKSTSNILEISKENTTQHATELALTTTGDMIDINDGCTITFKLKDKTLNTYVSAQPINIYVDGEYRASVTTDNNGQGSYNFGTDGLNHGLRKILLQYDGGTDALETILYKWCETEFEYSVGRKIMVTDYPTVFVNGSDYAQNKITADRKSVV